MGPWSEPSRDGTDGFTLIELLVTMIVIAILAAIAIPIFFQQRDKAFEAQSRSALANGKLMAESYFVGDGDGSYTGIEAPGALEAEGLRTAEAVELIVGTSGTDYCIVAVHTRLPGTHPWQRASIHSATANPSPDDTCAGYVL